MMVNMAGRLWRESIWGNTKEAAVYALVRAVPSHMVDLCNLLLLLVWGPYWYGNRSLLPLMSFMSLFHPNA